MAKSRRSIGQKHAWSTVALEERRARLAAAHAARRVDEHTATLNVCVTLPLEVAKVIRYMPNKSAFLRGLLIDWYKTTHGK